MTKKKTIAGELLHAAKQIQEWSTFNELLLKAWGNDPELLGMDGFCYSHPDTHKAYAFLCGKRGLVARGFLERKDLRYHITAKGIEETDRLRGLIPPPVAIIKLSKRQDLFLVGLFDHVILKKYDSPESSISFKEACEFWKPSRLGQSYQAAADFFDARIRRLLKLLENKTTVLSNGRFITQTDVAKMLEVNDFLKKKFNKHLELLKRRRNYRGIGIVTPDHSSEVSTQSSNQYQ